MRKCKILLFLLFNVGIALEVPEGAHAAFEAPQPDPISFALANEISFPDFLQQNDSLGKSWFISAGAARLFGMPEIQPFGFKAGANALGGQVRLAGESLSSGPYSETCAALGYGRYLSNSFWFSLEAQVSQIAIEDYGQAWAPQINAALRWDYDQHLSLAFTGINLTGSSIGEDKYPLPRSLALGGRFQPLSNLALLLEMEEDPRYALTPKVGVCFQPLKNYVILAGFQSDPNILSAGLSGLIGSIRATAAFQYHPDLGFSQCYGLALHF